MEFGRRTCCLSTKLIFEENISWRANHREDVVGGGKVKLKEAMGGGEVKRRRKARERHKCKKSKKAAEEERRIVGGGRGGTPEEKDWMHRSKKKKLEEAVCERRQTRGRGSLLTSRKHDVKSSSIKKFKYSLYFHTRSFSTHAPLISSCNLRPGRLTPCHRHLEHPLTSLCAPCLREHLFILNPSPPSTAAGNSCSTSSSSSAAFPELRRCKNFFADKCESLGLSYEPRRRSCEVRGRSSLEDLLIVDDEHCGGGSKAKCMVESKNLGLLGVPVAVFIMGVAAGLEMMSCRMLLIMSVISFGVVVASYGEINVNWVVVVYQMGGVVGKALRLIFMEIFVKRKVPFACSFHGFSWRNRKWMLVEPGVSPQLCRC